MVALICMKPDTEVLNKFSIINVNIALPKYYLTEGKGKYVLIYVFFSSK